MRGPLPGSRPVEEMTGMRASGGGTGFAGAPGPARAPWRGRRGA